MAWSKCKIEIGKTGDNDALPSSFSDIGTILNQSSSLSAENGDTMQMVATGGEIVAEEEQEGTLQLVTTVIEPESTLHTMLGIAVDPDESDTSGDEIIGTHLIDGDWAVKVTPKNKGAKGIIAPKCTITYQPAWSEENGHQAILTFKIHKTTELTKNYWYKKFTTTAKLP